MAKPRKTKSGPGMEGLIIPAGALLLGAFSWLMFGKFGFFVALMMVFFGLSVMSLYFFFRTRNVSYIAAFLFQSLIGMYLATLPESILPFRDVRGALFFYFFGLTMMVWLIYQAASKKARWKGREVFELAAEGVEYSRYGYTERPMPVGKIEGTKSELLGFADFLKRNLVSLSYWDDSSIYFVPVRMGQEYRYLFGFMGHYFQNSWISFDREGNVTVKISKKDYYHYLNELEFDHLCQSMGDLFIEFFEDYKRGDEKRIMNRLDSVGMNYWS
jgi:hypothetical protein